MGHNHGSGKEKAGGMVEAIEAAAAGMADAQQSARLPDFEDLDTFIISKPPAEPPLLVGSNGKDKEGRPLNGLIHKGDKVMLGAESKAGKTWWLIQKSLAVAAGVPFLGHETVKGRVLYCNFELKPWAFSRRVRRVAEAMGLLDGQGRWKDGNKPLFIPWNLRGKCYDIDAVTHAAAEKMAASGITDLAAIAVDPLYKSYGGAEENSATDMAAVLEAMERFAEKFGAAIFIASHFAKGDSAAKAQIDRISGSGVIARDPDSIMTLSKFKGEKNCYTFEATLRNMASPAAKVVEFEYPIWKVRPDLVPAGEGVNLKALSALLPDEGMSNEQWHSAAKEDGHVVGKDATWQKAKKACLSAGLAVEFSAGKTKVYKQARGKTI